ncbi:N-acetylmannosamine-6-phosphate 2-epimerase [uncultured Anaerococcus sp.]|uniref:N-acetylmannosamine-6-phosphate 2-epimerase n=1 Tax=uncultured Anaerococcus sp. TaxID=293428 RepID=UPI002608C182|nr:N-acetylmannosamine-6-phosphate 2-epimerase [uncultured Anaerococcus sp.]
MNFKEQVEKKLIVSCQALEDEPLHSSFIMGRMALAAKEGGAAGIRANTVEDIKEIRKNVDLPIIGIIKKDYANSEIYITTTMKEVDKLAAIDVDVIALDATNRKRPGGKTLEEFYSEIRQKYPNLKLMADCSTVDEAIFADKLGFDFIGTTLVGYTKESQGDKIDANDFEIIRTIIDNCKHPVIAEGNIDSPQKAKRVLELGAHTVVVGGAITRPQNIAKNFADEIASLEK